MPTDRTSFRAHWWAQPTLQLERTSGADPAKLQRQIARHGTSIGGIPPLWVDRCSDGTLMVYDGVTRATRVAKLLPGTTLTAEVIGTFNGAGSQLPTVGDRLSMSTSVRRELLDVLAELCEHAPEIRFGQLIAHLSCLSRGLEAHAVGRVEDEELLAAAKRHLRELKSREHVAT